MASEIPAAPASSPPPLTSCFPPSRSLALDTSPQFFPSPRKPSLTTHAGLRVPTSARPRSPVCTHTVCPSLLSGRSPRAPPQLSHGPTSALQMLGSNPAAPAACPPPLPEDPNWTPVLPSQFSTPQHTLLGLRPQAGVLLDPSLTLGPIPPRPLTLTHCLAPSFCLDGTVPLLPIPHICGPDSAQRPQLPAQPAASGAPHTTSVAHAVPSAVDWTLGPSPPHRSLSSGHWGCHTWPASRTEHCCPLIHPVARIQ